VGTLVTPAHGTAERDAALLLAEKIPGIKRVTLKSVTDVNELLVIHKPMDVVVRRKSAQGLVPILKNPVAERTGDARV
jgi:hypothetical protein